MTHENFKTYQQQLIEKVLQITHTKGIEYANNDADRLANFRRIGEELGIPAEKVCWILFKKHLDSLASYLRVCRTYSNEPIEGRIVDAMTYLTLLAALIKENKESERRGPE